MPSVRLRDIEVFYQEFGQGAPLLMIGGTQLDVSGWLFQAPEFSRTFRTILFDNRGTGRTSKPPGPYSTRLLAEDAICLLDHLGVKKTHVLGYSLGGMVAQQAALLQPDRIDRLVLVGTMCRVPWFARPVLRWRVRRAFRPGRDYRGLLEEMIALVVTPEYRETNGSAIRGLIEILCANHPSVDSFRGQLLACLVHDTSRELAGLRIPSLVIHGTRDRVIPWRWGREIARRIPGGRFESFEGGSHGLVWEDKDRFNRVVLEFLTA